MINDVTEKTQILSKNSQKRKTEEEKLAKEKAEIERKQNLIKQLKEKLAQKDVQLREKEKDLERHKIFSNFLDQVVQDKSGDKEGFNDILDLQDRFMSLKNENKKLMQKVSFISMFGLLFILVQKKQINIETDEAKQREKTKLNELKNTLYEQQKKMQNIQDEITEISERN